MKPNRKFLKLAKSFWANIRTISQQVGYTARRKGGRKAGGVASIKIPTLAEIAAALEDIELGATHLMGHDARPTALGKLVIEYLDYRASVLNSFVEPRLMNKEQAEELFEDSRRQLCPQCPLPMNKQKGDKQTHAYFTGVINMIIEAHCHGLPCDYDPRELTTVTRNNAPLRTLARRVDGAFPGPVNPIAVWEIKEYYYTTTFGSRVADGVYESLLDGMELEELREHEGVDVKHYLMIDDHYTWWDCGRSYLCRLIDMLHMGYVDEILFGTEVVERLPSIVKHWVQLAHKRSKSGHH